MRFQYLVFSLFLMGCGSLGFTCSGEVTENFDDASSPSTSPADAGTSDAGLVDASSQPVAGARYFYVSPDGNDATCTYLTEVPNSDNTKGMVFCRTLQHVADQVQPGDIVQVLPGDYVGFDLRTSGTPDKHISFHSLGGVKITSPNSKTPDGINLEGAQYIYIYGFEINNMPRAGIRGVWCDGSRFVNNHLDGNQKWGIITGWCNDVRIIGNTASNSVEQHGIYVSNSGDRPVILDNAIYGNHQNGIHMNGDIEMGGGDGIISGALVERNLIYNNGMGGGSSINCDGVQDSLFRNNLIYDAHSSGISLYKVNSAEPSRNNRLHHNTVIVADDGRWALNIQHGSTGNQLRNNIFLSEHAWKGSVDISYDSLPGLGSDFNLFLDTFTTDGGDTVINSAQWRNLTQGDMNSIVATMEETFTSSYELFVGSKAVDAAMPGYADHDFNLEIRPNGAGPDIGAEEFYPDSEPDAGAPVIPDAAPPISLPDASPIAPDAGTPIVPTSETLDSHWHPDSDNDGVLLQDDNCPYQYNPEQTPCLVWNNTEFIADLHVQQVTPYGAWFGYTSPITPDYDDWRAGIVWDTKPFATAQEVQGLILRKQMKTYGERSPRGRTNSDPIIVWELEPNTTYYAAVYHRSWDGSVIDVSNVVAFTTTANPVPATHPGHPFLRINQKNLETFQTRYVSGDKETTYLVGRMQSQVGRVVAGTETFSAHTYCVPAALVYHATQNPVDLARAKHVLNLLVTYHQDNSLGGNEYRYAAGELASCVDLLWNQLSDTEFNTALAAMTGDDINLSIKGYRMEDTDQFVSFTQGILMGSLLLCGDSRVTVEDQEIACQLRDYGLRRWFGAQMVNTYRNSGKYATSGGYLPDGSFYGQGTSEHWVIALLSLYNAGYPVEYATPFVRNNFLAHWVHSLTPSWKGYVTVSDVESFSGGPEKHSSPLSWPHVGPLGSYLAYFSSVGDTEYVNYVTSFLAHYDGTDYWVKWAEMAYDSDNTKNTLYHELPHAYADTGFGIVFDRTSWLTDASYMMVRGGWGGVDHTHGDTGHFQFYRRGEWPTHEAAGYLGPASTYQGHNVLNIGSGPSGGASTVEGITGVSRSPEYLYVNMDTTSAYNGVEQATRQLFWLKGESDTVIIRDYAATSVPENRTFTLHLDTPPVSTSTGVVSKTPGGQIVTLQAITPAVLVDTIPSSGNPGDYPATVYTHRVNVSTTRDQLITVTTFGDEEASLATSVTKEGTDLGVVVNGRPVLFEEVNGVSFESTPGPMWVVGLQPGQMYDVQISKVGTVYTVSTLSAESGAVADSAGVLYVVLP